MNGRSVRLLAGVACTALAVSAMAREPYESTYEPRPAEPVLIQNTTVLTGTGDRLENTDVHIADGMIMAVGSTRSEGADRQISARMVSSATSSRLACPTAPVLFPCDVFDWVVAGLVDRFPAPSRSAPRRSAFATA